MVPSRNTFYDQWRPRSKISNVEFGRRVGNAFGHEFERGIPMIDHSIGRHLDLMLRSLTQQEVVTQLRSSSRCACREASKHASSSTGCLVRKGLVWDSWGLVPLILTDFQVRLFLWSSSNHIDIPCVCSAIYLKRRSVPWLLNGLVHCYSDRKASGSLVWCRLIPVGTWARVINRRVIWINMNPFAYPILLFIKTSSNLRRWFIGGGTFHGILYYLT